MAQPSRHAAMLSISNSNPNHTVAAEKPQPTQQIQTIAQTTPGLRVPSNRKTIYDRHLNRSRNAESSRASFAFLFAEMVTYAQRRVTGIQDLEKRYVCPPETNRKDIYPETLLTRRPTASTNKATPSASAFLTFSSTAQSPAPRPHPSPAPRPPHRRRTAPSASSPCYTSSTAPCGASSSTAPPTPSNTPSLPTRRTST
ncbi:Trafficking protein particle complex subunit 31 [Aspergillus melleus]|uniref:Trafficking protein particle complex subunit 31 n=1 Tax=Aspergillus melleus TaxID=138277 RepID=UPI001E8DCFDF|nr:Trafficking protein particle complex subunit 31 [Aspergillus melleus]KAH8427216.1 Trafficking protein particle complex subunit 31 [Aspergillus melleus]